ncbi:hypothetical protein ILUMI_26203 [Ignelater luminosus]|uniref:Uncharacterized protein n=1 Tax=Ignelater luminosus TaxID=2038154 RepID=A0A8K0CA74_IGNLU|nr:hypothetical protein ILUMI_26203 [Ignelater luminosus]
MSQINIETRKLILHKWGTEGLSMGSIPKLTKCFLTGVQKVICKYGEHGFLNDLKGRGRKKGTSCPRVEEKVVRFLTTKRNLSVRNAARKVGTSINQLFRELKKDALLGRTENEKYQDKLQISKNDVF